MKLQKSSVASFSRFSLFGLLMSFCVISVIGTACAVTDKPLNLEAMNRAEMQQAASAPVDPDVLVSSAALSPWSIRLSALAPLTKTHWSWPVTRDDDWYTDSERRAVALQIARICGSWSPGYVHWLRPVDHERWEQGIALAAEAEVSINVEVSPYHREFTEVDPNPCLRNDLHQLAVTRFADNLAQVKSWCDAAGVELALVMFDHELFHTTQAARNSAIRGTVVGERWDACVAEKLLAFDRIARELVPEAKVVWYAAPNKSRGQGWIGPRCDYYMPSLYYPACTWGEKNHAAYWQSQVLGIWVTWPPTVIKQIPCVALASGYRPVGDGRYWRHDWDYDARCSHDLGAWLRGVKYLDSVYFYPEPSPPGQGRHPAWIKHFEQYVLGWHQQPVPHTGRESKQIQESETWKQED